MRAILIHLSKSCMWLSFRRITTFLVILIASSIPIQANEAKYDLFPGSVINANLDDEVDLRSVALAGPVLPPETKRLLRYVGIQVIDQALHVVMGAGPIWASRYLVGVPWYGWLATPVLAYREWRQWPSNRWWDPPLDWTFLTLGVVVATWGPARRRKARKRTGERIPSTA
jgi:hypothetical protein